VVDLLYPKNSFTSQSSLIRTCTQDTTQPQKQFIKPIYKSKQNPRKTHQEPEQRSQQHHKLPVLLRAMVCSPSFGVCRSRSLLLHPANSSSQSPLGFGGADATEMELSQAAPRRISGLPRLRWGWGVPARVPPPCKSELLLFRERPVMGVAVLSSVCSSNSMRPRVSLASS
jgi:hypothetical protein